MWAITAAVVASTAAGIYGQSVSAKAQQAQIKDQMRQEELAAQSEELARREQLNEALAANMVDVASSGVQAESFASLNLNNARKMGLAESQQDLTESLRRAALQRKSKNVSAIRDAGIVSSLLNAGTSYLSLKGPSNSSSGGGET